MSLILSLIEWASAKQRCWWKDLLCVFLAEMSKFCLLLAPSDERAWADHSCISIFVVTQNLLMAQQVNTVGVSLKIVTICLVIARYTCEFGTNKFFPAYNELVAHSVRVRVWFHTNILNLTWTQHVIEILRVFIYLLVLNFDVTIHSMVATRWREFFIDLEIIRCWL